MKKFIILASLILSTGSAFADGMTFSPSSDGFVVTTDYQRLKAVLADSVKKSKSEICHAPDSTSYERTKNYTAYPTLDDCLNSSDKARLPKNYTRKD